MKKFLLVSVCLLALTACSQGQQGKGTTNASSKQEATQTKKEQVQNKTFVSDLGDHHQNKIQIGYKEELEHSDIYKSLNGKPGLSFRIQISKDKQSYAKVLQADFSKIKKDEFASIYGDQGEEETAEFKKYLNGKPQDLFTYFKDQGLKEEK